VASEEKSTVNGEFKEYKVPDTKTYVHIFALTEGANVAHSHLFYYILSCTTGGRPASSKA